MPVIPELGRVRQEDYKFQADLSYRVRPCLINKTKHKPVHKECDPHLHILSDGAHHF
jgi:hypothetical protein